jgi:acid phosphatase class B
MAKFEGKKKVSRRGWSVQVFGNSVKKNAKKRGIPAKAITAELIERHHKAQDTVFHTVHQIEAQWERSQKKAQLPAVIEAQ